MIGDAAAQRAIKDGLDGLAPAVVSLALAVLARVVRAFGHGVWAALTIAMVVDWISDLVTGQPVSRNPYTTALAIVLLVLIVAEYSLRRLSRQVEKFEVKR